MRQLQSEAAGNVDGPLFRELFLQHLPVNIWAALASLDSALSLEQLAKRADRMTEAGSMSTTVSTVGDTQDCEINRLQADMADLKRLFQMFTTSSPRSNTSGKPKEASKTENSEPQLCWYHFHFGNAAQKCRPPCSWAGNCRARHLWRHRSLATLLLEAYFLTVPQV